MPQPLLIAVSELCADMGKLAKSWTNRGRPVGGMNKHNTGAPVTTLQKALLWVGALLWIALAIAPASRAAWLLENVLAVVGVAWVVGTYRHWRLSETSYGLIFAFFALHAVGAHYTYAKVPLGEWLRTDLSLERNAYDRLVHFCFGFLLVCPFRDQVTRAVRLPPHWGSAIAFMIITSVSTAYELLEWSVIEIVKPEDAVTFLGMQGDVFDAQKDMALAMLGAALGLTVAGFAARCVHVVRGRGLTGFPSPAGEPPHR
ncbi:MAG: DUF2238 domain-containing protein [Rhodospirillaceae bacterium]